LLAYVCEDPCTIWPSIAAKPEHMGIILKGMLSLRGYNNKSKKATAL